MYPTDVINFRYLKDSGRYVVPSRDDARSEVDRLRKRGWNAHYVYSFISDTCTIFWSGLIATPINEIKCRVYNGEP